MKQRALTAVILFLSTPAFAQMPGPTQAQLSLGCALNNPECGPNIRLGMSTQGLIQNPLRGPIAHPVGPVSPVTGGGSCPVNLSGSHSQISQCGQAFNQCESVCKSQQCVPTACSESQVCTVDSTGTSTCNSVPCNVQTCSQQSQSCGSQCKSTYSSCIGQIDQSVEQACGAPTGPAQCQNWSQGLSNNECSRQKQTCESRCALSDGNCRYNCIYSQVKCHERLQSDLGVFCNQPQQPVVSQPPANPVAPRAPIYAPVAREPASLAGDRIQ